MNSNYSWRFYFLAIVLLLCVLGLAWRMAYLSVQNRAFLLKQSDARALRVIDIPAYRGMITDRNGVPLAVSTPVDSVWLNPQAFQATPQQLQQLASLLNTPVSEIQARLKENADHEFVYLVRGIPPEIADQIKTLNITGIFSQREYRRYYPEGEVTAHIIGFTNIDDSGQEGLELAFNNWLQGAPGKKQVLKDRLGQTVANLGILQEPQQGRDLTLSIDSRIQYIAYTTLINAIPKFQATSGSIVVLNVKTGEILAMANVPSYNPNHRPAEHDGRYRNRAVTDIFEPGSIMKTFSIAAAINSGKYHPNSLIDTSPGWMTLKGGYVIRDDTSNGVINVTQVLQKSSNIGVAKMTLSLPPENLWNMLGSMGFGERSASGFPGEAAGVLVKRRIWSPTDLATLAYGYGMSATPLQLAAAYAVIANDGIKIPVTFLKTDKAPLSKRAITEQLSKTMLTMLQANATAGSGTKALIPGYQVGGKTGTAYTMGPHGYIKDKYSSSFVGIAPISNPQLVVLVVLHGVHGDIHFGGQVSAPIFATVMASALRYLNISPDNLNAQMQITALPVKD